MIHVTFTQYLKHLILEGLLSEVRVSVGSYLWTASVQSPLRVKVRDGSAGDVHADQRPVDLQVDRDQQQIFLEDVHLVGVEKR